MTNHMARSLAAVVFGVGVVALEIAILGLLGTLLYIGLGVLP